MDGYFERFGGVRDYLRSIVAQARLDGYTETVLGRRRYLPDLTSDNRQRREMAERMALNAPIQGSAADIIKVAMLRVDDAPERGRAAIPDAAAGARRARLRGGAGGAGGSSEALVRDSMAGGLPARRAAGGLGRRRPRTGPPPTTDPRPMTRQPLVVQAPHGQVDDRSSHPACLVGSHEDRRVCHLGKRHEPSRVGPAC